MRKINKCLLILLGMMFTKNTLVNALNIQSCNDTNLACQKNIADKFSFVKENAKLSGAGVTDSKFSLKDYNLVTSIKDQQDTSACWAFATNASIESNMLMNNLGEYDLSEAHLELATQNKYNNNRTTFNRNKDTGGNYSIAAAYIMNAWGPVKEEVLPFEKLLKSYNNEEHIYATDIINNKAIIDVNSIAFLGNDGACMQNTIKDMKEYLITNGALTANIYVANENKKNTYLYYNGEEKVNHGITIIGWDDTVSKDEFTTSKPQNNGAWLVKNSYGGDSYQYVSYEDVHICNNVVGFFDTESEVEDNAYYYDNLGANTTNTLNSNNAYLVSIFKKKSIRKEETLKEVAMYFSKLGQKYEIYFANRETKDLEEATKIGEGESSFVGYKTIKVTPQTISNDKYTIIIKLTDSENIKIEVSQKYENTAYSNMKFTEGVQFISMDGETYYDTTKDFTSPYHLTIRSFTNTTNKVSSAVSQNNSTVSSASSDNDTKNSVDNTQSVSATVGDSKDTPTDNPKTGMYLPISMGIVALAIILANVKKTKFKKMFKI